VTVGDKGFFTDVSVCIGCKACEVACKEWNQLPDDGFKFTGMSYDNTRALGAATWRHVGFVETREPAENADAGRLSWRMFSDVCKHCETAGCLEACPTGAIDRTVFGSVVIQPVICNGCGYCVAACPFGVVERREDDGRAWKCTMCYDRLKGGMEPACAKACPTDSIVFGDLDVLRELAEARVEELHAQGVSSAQLYGARAEDQPGTDGLHAFFLLLDEPALYGLPSDPIAPSKVAGSAWRSVFAASAALGAVVLGAVFSGGGR
jgi:formate dehydrogenase iron-sulfur subunit